MYCGGSGRAPTAEGGFGCLSRKIEPNRQVPFLIFIDHLHKLLRSDQSKKKRSQTPSPQVLTRHTRPHRTSISRPPRPQTAVAARVGRQRQQSNRVCIHVKIRQHNRTDRPASTCERYTQGGVVTAYKNEREHSNPSWRGPGGGWKSDKILAQGSCSDPGIGMQLHCTNDSSRIQWPGPIRTVGHAVASVFSCANGRW